MTATKTIAHRHDPLFFEKKTVLRTTLFYQWNTWSLSLPGVSVKPKSRTTNMGNHVNKDKAPSFGMVLPGMLWMEILLLTPCTHPFTEQFQIFFPFLKPGIFNYNDQMRALETDSCMATPESTGYQGDTARDGGGYIQAKYPPHTAYPAAWLLVWNQDMTRWHRIKKQKRDWRCHPSGR